MTEKDQLPKEIQGGNPVFEPATQEERVRNQGIAKRIKSLLEKCGLSSVIQFLDTKLFTKSPDFAFWIYSLKEEGEYKFPDKISYPLYALELQKQTRMFRNDDGKIYHFEIAYLFNEEGQGLQSLLIKKDSLEMHTANAARNYPLTTVPANLIDVPKFSSIKDEDFHNIEALITKAENEKWSKPQVLKPNTVIITRPSLGH